MLILRESHAVLHLAGNRHDQHRHLSCTTRLRSVQAINELGQSFGAAGIHPGDRPCRWMTRSAPLSPRSACAAADCLSLGLFSSFRLPWWPRTSCYRRLDSRPRPDGDPRPFLCPSKRRWRAAAPTRWRCVSPRSWRIRRAGGCARRRHRRAPPRSARSTRFQPTAGSLSRWSNAGEYSATLTHARRAPHAPAPIRTESRLRSATGQRRAAARAATALRKATFGF